MFFLFIATTPLAASACDDSDSLSGASSAESRGNRTTQETFSSEACVHAAPADFVSGTNLAQRLSSDVLRPALHTFDKFGRASPLPMSRAAIKSLLAGQGAGGVIELLTPATPKKNGLLKRVGLMKKLHP